MIKHYSLKILQKAMNAALSLDDTMPAKLDAFSGKVIALVIVPLQVKIFITFQNQSIILNEDYTQGQPDTTIESSPLGLIRLSLLPVSKARSLFHDEVVITGDIQLGQQIKQLFDGIDIDWEGHIARLTGDVIAYQIGSVFRRGMDFHRQVTSSLTENVKEYVQEELKVLPSAEEARDVSEDIEELAQTVERLQAQINWLMSNHEKR